MKDSQLKKIYFTSSWDDGSVNDLKLLKLLNKYNIKGTFYVPKEFDGKGSKFSEYNRQLSDKEIIEIASGQEIGSHSLTHRSLVSLDEKDIKEEMAGSKIYLENIIGRQVEMLCPPNGLFDERVTKIAGDAGYLGMRTTKKLSFKLSQNKPFGLDVSIICNPFPFRKKDSSKIYWRRASDPIKGYGGKILSFPTIYFNLFSWPSFAKAFFRYVIKNGNYFHLYGHSWELEKYQMWNELEDFLKYVKEFYNIEYLTNSQIVELLNHENSNS